MQVYIFGAPQTAINVYLSFKEPKFVYTKKKPVLFSKQLKTDCPVSLTYANLSSITKPKSEPIFCTWPEQVKVRNVKSTP